MPDIPMGWATLIGAGLTALAAIAACVITAILGTRTRRDVQRVASDTREVKQQVKNSHDTNLREEQDDRHTELIREIKAVRSTQASHGRRLDDVQRTQRGMQRDIGRLADADQEQTRSDHRLGERITELEKTQPTQPKHPTQGDTPDE